LIYGFWLPLLVSSKLFILWI